MTTNPSFRILAVGAAVLLAGTTVACSDGDASATPVLASTSVWADITSRVACGEPVSTLIPAGADAHEYEPSVADADALRGAELVVTNGLGLESGFHDALDTAAADGVSIIEVGPAAEPLLLTKDQHEDEHEHEHGEVDPHVWMDPDRVAAVIPALADALAGVDALGIERADLERCAQEYLTELEELAGDMDRTLAAVEADRRNLVTNHEALAYFADRFGFTVVGAVIPSTSSLAEANPRDLDELERTMRSLGVSTVFAETTAATRLAESLADRLGEDAAVVELHAESLTDDGEGASDYLEMMRTNAELVAGALSDEQ